MIRLSGAMLVLALGAAQTASQPPIPSPPIETQGEQDQASDEQSRAGPGQPGVSIAITNAPVIQGERSSEEEQTDCCNNSPPIGNAIATWLIVGFTGVLTTFTVFQFLMAQRADWHFQIVERAYVKMSHEPPGVTFVPDRNNPKALRASIKITNTGNTPAEILEMRWIPATTKAELDAEHGRDVVPRTTPSLLTLMPRDNFSYWGHVDSIPSETLKKIVNGELRLWLVGSVTYLDRFSKVRHQSGYGREFMHETLPGKEGNNLKFMVEDRRYPNFHRERDL